MQADFLQKTTNKNNIVIIIINIIFWLLLFLCFARKYMQTYTRFVFQKDTDTKKLEITPGKSCKNNLKLDKSLFDSFILLYLISMEEMCAHYTVIRAHNIVLNAQTSSQNGEAKSIFIEWKPNKTRKQKNDGKKINKCRDITREEISLGDI